MHPDLFPDNHIGDFYESNDIQWDFRQLSSEAQIRIMSLKRQQLTYVNDENHKRDLMIKRRLSWIFKKPLVYITTNRGRTVTLLRDNRAEAKNAALLGLNPVNAFPCMFKYLFSPKPAIRVLARPFESKLRSPDVTSVCMHIRSGDKHINNNKLMFRVRLLTDKFHSCAMHIMQKRQMKMNQTIFLLATDSIAARSYMRKKIGPRLTWVSLSNNSKAEIGHVAMGSSRGFWETIAVEQYLFANACDIHILSSDSGYGKVHEVHPLPIFACLFYPSLHMISFVCVCVCVCVCVYECVCVCVCVCLISYAS